VLGKRGLVINGAILIIILLFQAGVAQAAAIKATPRLIVIYGFKDNLYGNDPDELVNGDSDIVSASYLDYLLGIAFSYKQTRDSVAVSGELGYEQYLTIDGWVEDYQDDDPAAYNHLRAKVKAIYAHQAARYNFEIWDEIIQNRDLQDIFGDGTDAIGYWALYANNIAGLSLKLSPGAKTRVLIQYTYHSIIFMEPENDIPEPSESYEHRGFVRLEYKISSKTTGIVDVQGASRTFEDTEDDFANDTKAADYNLIQAMLGINYRFSDTTQLIVLGGWAQRDYYNLSDTVLAVPPWPVAYQGQEAYELEDMSDPVARISLLVNVPDRYNFDITGYQGISTYGQNLFFDYTSAEGNFTYFITPKLSAIARAKYRRVFYDVEENGREWQWDDDRIDEITSLSAALAWDILQKGGQGTLSLSVGYGYQIRESNIDDTSTVGNEDYNPDYAALFPVGYLMPSYDAVTSTYYVRLTILPTVLFAK